MKTLCTSLLMAITVLGLWAQDDDPAAKGKAGVAGKAGGTKGGTAKGAAAKGGGKGGGAPKGKGKAAEPPAPPNVPQVLRLIRPDMYLVTAHGDNVVFRITPEGVILVNSKLAAEDNYERLAEFIRGVTQQKVKYILNSREAPDATGNNARFQSADAEVVTGERTVKLAGVEASTLKFGDHTAIYFPASRTVYLGELYKTATGEGAEAPAPAPGAAAALDALLKLDWTLAVPAEGEPVYRKVVEEYRKKLP